jgi:hypothetical protein
MRRCVWNTKGWGPQVYKSQCALAAFVEVNPPKDGEPCTGCGRPMVYDHTIEAAKAKKQPLNGAERLP